MAKKKKEVIKKPDAKGRIEEIKELWAGDTFRFVSGFLILIVAIFMFLAFMSHFVTGAEDQSIIDAQINHELNGSNNEIQNYAGSLGAQTASFFMNRCFGVAAFFIPIFLVFASMKLMRAYRVRLWKWFLNCSFLMIWISVATAMVCQKFLAPEALTALAFSPGGNHGNNICDYISSQIGLVGLFAVLLTTAVFYLIYISRETINVVRNMLNPKDYIASKKRGNGNDDENVDSVEEETTANVEAEGVERESAETKVENIAPVQEEFKQEPTVSIDLMEQDTKETEEKVDNSFELSLDTEPEVKVEKLKEPISLTSADSETNSEPEFKIETQVEEEKAGESVKSAVSLEPYDPKKDLENYNYPPISLLKKYSDQGPSIDMEEQNANKNKIITILRNFGVEISSIKATIGPTITLYEITPAVGVRISKIRNLEDDIALSLSALGIRIIAPIPGKGTIGIEVPNSKPCIVSMESIINSKKFQECDYELPIALGKTITNEVFIQDLAKMPHLLVAGATGQGKSVGLNAVITSLVYKKHPSELKFVMVDPKKVEFSMYSPIEKHFLAKIPDDKSDAIITDVSKVIQTLKSLCQEMDTRYDLLKRAHVRNVKEYNQKFKSRGLNPDKGHRFMPYIVVIIDEFGDLIMTAGKEVELPIARIAQLARAVGIHMVIATQRPTTNIITGTIKANFPARMAFKVTSVVDSRTILDRTGANQLVGRGDMLFLAGNDPVRVQCAFVDTPEVEQITEYISKQQGYLSALELPEVEMDSSDSSAASNAVDMNSLDPMFQDAARLIVIHQQGSTSLLQRKFAIGYNRAGRLMDQLEKAGIVGPAQGAKPRDVLCSDETDLEMKLTNLL